MSQDNDKSPTAILEQGSDDDGQGVVEGNVSSLEPRNDNDDGEQSESDDKPEEAEITEKARRTSELHRLLQETANDEAGSKELGDKLEKWKDPNDPNLLEDLVNTPLEGSKTTPLHITTDKEFLQMTRRLLEAGANINAQDDEGRQPIHIACNSGNDDLLILLLKCPDYTPKRDDEGQYPLHTACYWASSIEPGTFRLFRDSDISHINETTYGVKWTPLNMATYWGKEQAVDILLEAKPKLGIQDDEGWTPLIAAAKEGYYGIFNKLANHLKTEPRTDVVDVVDKRDNQGMTALMDLCVASSKDAENSQGALKSLENILDLHPSIDIVDNQGQTALHHIMYSAAVAKALGSAMAEVLMRILTSAPSEVLLLRDNQGHTAFDVVFEEDGMVTDLEPFFRTVVGRLVPHKLDQLFSWLAQGKERYSFANELLLLDIWGDTQVEQFQLKPRDLGEWAICRRLPGSLLDYMMAIGQNEQKNGHIGLKEARERWKTLIRHLKYEERQKKPDRDLRRDVEKKEMDDQAIYSEDRTRDDRINILQDLEDIVDFFFVEKASTSEESRRVSVPTPEMRESLAQFYAAVIQMRQDGDELIRFTKFRTVQDVIYGTENLATVGETIRRFEKMRSASKAGTDSAREDAKLRKEFTWIHLPATNDIVKKVLGHSDYEDDEFEELASFLRASWVEIPDRTSASRYMRPRFVERRRERDAITRVRVKETEDPTNIEEDRGEGDDGQISKLRSGKTKLVDTLALYMPYLSLSTYHTRDRKHPKLSATDELELQEQIEPTQSEDDSQKAAKAMYRREQRNRLFRAYRGKPIHASPTLDEYYYHFGKDAESEKDQDLRNSDQVVTKYLHPQGVEGAATWSLLRVNQLWAWTIGEDWLITATSCTSSDEQSKFVTDILTYLRKRARDGSHWHEPTSPADLRKVIAEYCISVYERKYELHGRDELGVILMFGEGQPLEKEQQLTSLKSASRKAAKLLFEIRDARDELNILRSIVRAQQAVQSPMARREDITALYIFNDIRELDAIAARTQAAVSKPRIDMTFYSQIANLQADESVKQSRLANRQAEESAKLG
ncbi:hypothetical protein FDECE_4563 [Fusarium decemcellulare]|nr:hypothetical protein FDECE_4563 [Fusarium decemcellulare]